MYIILELQTNNGVVSMTPAIQKTDRKEAESVYHSILAAAAISGLDAHSAVLMTNEGELLMSQCYSA